MKSLTFRLAGMAAMLILCRLAALGAPFAEKIPFTQPDGTQIVLWGQGDEFHAVFETLDGYTVTFNQQTKAYDYAGLSADGDQLISTGVTVGQGDPSAMGLKPHVRINPEAAKKQAAERFARWDQAMEITGRWNALKTERRLAEMSVAQEGPEPSPPSSTTTGQKLGLTLLIDFSDAVATIAQAEIINFCNGNSYTGYGNNGSVKKYYLDNSNNQLTYSNVVTIYIRAPQPKTYYNNTTNDCGIQGRLLITDAINAMKALTNYTTDILPTFASLTVDGSSRVVACNVFFAGANSGVWSYGLWPHSWSLASAIDLGNGKKVYKYQITNIGTSLALGTFCHENGHMLCGFPDIYDYDYDSQGGAGIFCLMDYGGSGGNPVQVCAYLKRAAGWATTIGLTSSSMLTASVSSSGTDFNKFYRYAKPGVATEYFLVENRQKSGRDANLPASGVAIWHIDELGNKDYQNTNFNTIHTNYEVSLMQADNLWHFQNDVNSGDSKDLYYLGNTATGYSNRFNDATSPGARWWDGSASGILFHHFSASATTMTFGVGLEGPVIAVDSASLTAEGCMPTNGVVDANETVTVSFALKNNGGRNTTNLVATLLATNGVTSPSGAQTYGAVITNGAAIARSFTFNATGACGGVLAAVLQLQDGTNNLGTATNTFILGALGGSPVAANYSSGGVAVTIPDNTTVEVPLPITDIGAVADVNVLVRLNHTYVGDLVLSLVHPDGTVIALANNRGTSGDNYGSGANSCAGTFTVFDDSASTAISSGTAPFAGSYKPEDLLSSLNGKSLSGTWKLRVADTAADDTGTIYCFQLDISRQVYVCCTGASADLGLVVTDTPDPVTVSSNLTYNLTVTNLGPAMAASLTVTDALPGSVTFLSASVSQGTWATNGGSLFTCALGDINANGSATISIVVEPSSSGSISNTATVSSSSSDPNSINNTAIAVTTVNVAPPTIAQPPQPQNVCPGATATFTVAAAGAGPLSYQWQTNSLNLTNGGHYGGVTTSNLTVTAADSTVLGDYRCVVSNQGGSTPSSAAALTISDTTPPTITCPPDVTVSAHSGCSATNVALGSSTTGDNCGVAGVTNNGLGSYPVGTNVVTWTVTDTSGNTSSCQQRVIVLDDQAPTIVWHMTNVVVAAGTNCQALMPDLTGTNYLLAVDNCSSVTVTQSVATNTLLGLGTNEVVLGVLDTAGNVAYCTNSVLVLDQTPPTITCPTDLTVTNDPAQCGAVVHYAAPVGQDTCAGPVTTQVAGLASGSWFPVGKTTNLFKVTDVAGNSAEGGFVVTVDDTELPQITWHMTNVVVAAGTNCQAVMPDITGTNYLVAVDNCSSVTVTQSVATNTLLGLGTNEVVLGVLDTAGNVVYCTNSVLVLDQTPPTITCPTDLTVTNDPGQCGAVVHYAAPVGQDTCAGPVTTQVAGLASGSWFPVGKTTNLFKVTDVAGNSAEGGFVVTVDDTELPQITWHMTNVVVAAGTNCQAVMPDITGTNYLLAVDNCSSVTVTQSVATNTLLGLGTNEVVLGVLDTAGNVVYCTNSVLVLDQTPPTITCPTDLTVTNDPGQCGAVVHYAAPVGQDTCAGPVTTQVAGLASGSWFPVGKTTNLFKVTDVAGNSAEGGFVVTVDDTELPQITWHMTNVVVAAGTNCQALMLDITGTKYLLAVDNCSSVTVTQSVATNTLLGVGTNEVVLGVLDTAGNVVYCTNSVLVLDQTPPTITCPTDLTVTNDPGQCGAVVSYPAPVGQDTCAGPVTTQVAGLASGSLFPVGKTTNLFKVTDVAGNSAEGGFVVTVDDTELPLITWYITNVVVAAETNCQALMPDLTGTNYLLAVDNCSSVTVTQSVATNTLLGLGTNEVVLGALDTAGNVVYCTNYVLVLDQTPPTIACPADLTVTNDPGQCGAVVSYPAPVGQDTCAGPVTTQVAGLASGSWFPVGKTTNLFKVTDVAGNSAEGGFVVTVDDTELPLITWHITNVVVAAGTNCEALMPDLTGTNYLLAVDNCSSVTVTQSVATNTLLGLGTNEVVLGALDTAGNVVYCTNYVLVLDQTPPTIACPANMVVSADAGQCSKSNVTWEVTASDNCAVTNLVSEPPSGSTFPGGVMTVTCTATDASGNTSRCNFTVMVIAPPCILAQPISQTVTQGQDAVFTVTATNNSGHDLSYQWRWNGGEIALATDSAYTRNNIQCADAGGFDVVVASLAGSQTSSIASLAVVAAPLIVTGPAGQTVSVGQEAAFTVTATNGCGNGLSYQWRFQGLEIPGATANCYTLTTVQLTNAGNYDVVVTNLAAAATSPVAVLTVAGPYLTVYPLELSQSGSGRTNFIFTFPSVAGLSYLVQYKYALADTSDWLPLITNSGTGGLITNDFPITTDPPARFYRVLIP